MKKTTLATLIIIFSLVFCPLVKAKPSHAGKGKQFKDQSSEQEQEVIEEQINKGKGGQAKGKNQQTGLQKHKDSGFKASHPVFGDGKLHPVHDDKVIGKFKNASKIKDRVSKIDSMPDGELNTELEKIKKEIKVIKDNDQRNKTKLEQIQNKKQQLLKEKETLSTPDTNPVKNTMNKFGLLLNDMNLKQTELAQSTIEKEIKADQESLEAADLIKSYLEVKHQ